MSSNKKKIIIRINLLWVMFLIYSITMAYSQKNSLNFIATTRPGFIPTKIDTLLFLVQTDKEDTNKINHLNDLCFEYKNIGKYDTALYYGNLVLQLATLIFNETKNTTIKQTIQKNIALCYNNMGLTYSNLGDYPIALEYYFKALKINEEVENKKGIATNLSNIGIIYFEQGDYLTAKEYYINALNINEEIGNKKGVVNNLNNIGNVYADQGDCPQALKYYFKALKINNELGDKNKIAVNLGNIGLVYDEQSDYIKALEYYNKALEFAERIGEKKKIATNLNNIGNIYYKQGDFPKALKYHFKALKINSELKNKNGIAFNFGNIGSVYYEEVNYPKALEYYFKALQINKELGNKNGIALNLGNIGEVYTKQKKYKEAEKYLLKALETSTEIGALYLIKFNHETLSELYSQTNQYKLAYEHYKQYTAAKDSLFNEDKSKEIGRLEMQHEIEIAEMERERIKKDELKIKNQKKERKHLLQYSGIIIGLLIIGLLITFLGFIKVKSWIAEGITFFAFLLFFEFLLVLLDPYLDKFTNGEPAYKLLINALVAACIFPLHALFEKILKRRLIKTN